jgi:hypothetical protein
MSTQNCRPGLQVAPVAWLHVSNPVKIQLIRKYQRNEGNYDCCASAYIRVCQQLECLWRDECLALAKDDARS